MLCFIEGKENEKLFTFFLDVKCSTMDIKKEIKQEVKQESDSKVQFFISDGYNWIPIKDNTREENWVLSNTPGQPTWVPFNPKP